MSQLGLLQLCHKTQALSSYFVAYRGLSTTACIWKNRKSGVPKITTFRTKPLTYDQAIPPSQIYVRKGWLSWNTTNLYAEPRHAETTFEDVLLRRFVAGTWHRGLCSEVVIKRRNNLIILAFLISMDQLLVRQVYFLKGYTEELLTQWLKCPVKVELQTVDNNFDVVFKKI